MGRTLEEILESERPGVVSKATQLATEMLNDPKGYTNVFEALEDNPTVAADLKARADIILQLTDAIEARKLNPLEAAAALGIAPSRVDDLLGGKIEAFDTPELEKLLQRVTG